MYTLTTTLNKIRVCSPCMEGWATLLRSTPGMNHDTEFNILCVLDSNGVQGLLWCLRATDGNMASVALAIAFAESALHIFESALPGDNIPRLAIESAKAYLADPSRDASRAAAYASDASYAARAASYAARAAQVEIIRSILE